MKAMIIKRSTFMRGGLIALLLLACSLARALTGAEAAAIATGDNDSRIAALSAAATKGDARLAALVQALLADEVKVAAGKVLIVHDGKTTDAASGSDTTLPEGAEDVTNNNRMRGALEAVLASLTVSYTHLTLPTNREV